MESSECEFIYQSFLGAKRVAATSAAAAGSTLIKSSDSLENIRQMQLVTDSMNIRIEGFLCGQKARRVVVW